MWEWFFNWLDKLDGNVDGAVFGLGKAVKKLDKAIEANGRVAARQTDKALALDAKITVARSKADTASSEAARAARVKAKVEEILK